MIPHSKSVTVEDTSPEVLDQIYRSSGLVVCNKCHKTYYEHPVADNILNWQGDPWVNVLCNGDLVHL